MGFRREEPPSARASRKTSACSINACRAPQKKSVQDRDRGYDNNQVFGEVQESGFEFKPIFREIPDFQASILEDSLESHFELINGGVRRFSRR